MHGDAANTALERIVERIEPANEQLTRTLWDAASYIDNEITSFARGGRPPRWLYYCIMPAL